MRKVFISLIFICSLFSLLGQHKANKSVLQHNRAVVNEINAMPLYKLLFIYDVESQSMKWNYAGWLGEYHMIAYLDTKGRVRKFIYSSITEDIFWYIVCYYDEEGQLILFIGINSATASGRFNALDFSESVVIYSIGEKVISQDIKRSFLRIEDWETETQRDICSDCEFPAYLGDDISILPFTSTALLVEHIGLNLETINWRNGAIVTFGSLSESDVLGTIVNRNNVSIFSQPCIESEVVFVIDAGGSVSVRPYQQPIQQIKNGTYTIWYRVEFFGLGYGYIDSRYLEPVERRIEE